MEIERDAETIGLLFKALARHRCVALPALARQLGVDYGPPLLEALGLRDDPRSRWAEVEALVGALQHRAWSPGEAGDEGLSVAAPVPPGADAGPPALAFPAPEVRRGPTTALGTLREAVGLTAGQLAAKVGVPVATVGAWERGAATPEARQLGRLAQALGVTPEAVRAALGVS